MNPVPCRWCGRPVLWVPRGNSRVPIENELTPYRFVKNGGVNVLYTSEGAQIRCEILPDSRENEASGYAHRYHFCAKRPLDYKPPTEREQRRADYKEWRQETAEE